MKRSVNPHAYPVGLEKGLFELRQGMILQERGLEGQKGTRRHEGHEEGVRDGEGVARRGVFRGHGLIGKVKCGVSTLYRVFIDWEVV